MENNPEIAEFMEAEGPDEDSLYDIVESLRASMFQKWNTGTANVSKIPEVVGDVMHIVERTGKLSGAQKKKAAVGLVVQVVDDWNLGGALEPMVLQMIPGLIDTLLMAEKGKLHIKKKARLSCACLF